MQVFQISSFRAAFKRLEWQRGARAGISVGTAMLFCLLLHRPIGWIALGALYICLVDNGGPYRSRLGNMLTIAALGSLAVLLGSVANPNLLVGLIVTIAFFFSMTLARVLSQPLAATSVLILICYIVSFGGEHNGLATASINAAYFFTGGIWAAAIALALWPVDPFRPAREAIADVYNALSQITSSLSLAPEIFNEGLALTRIRIETAGAALAATPARMTVRTIRARNLTVLNECADLLIARILRFAELAETSASTEPLRPVQSWLIAQLQHIEAALRERPINVSAFGPDGSLSIDMHHSESRLEASLTDTNSEASKYLITTLRDTCFNFDLAYEALRAVWTGAESRQSEAADFRATLRGESSALSSPATWLETLRSNLTLRSVMFRHALRLSAVISIDVFLTRYIHVTHSYWFAMTSLIVLRPFAGETVRRSFDRVAGTVAGGILAAAFTAIITNQTELLVLVVICSAGCVAFYAVDYAWYCFFVTPAIVLLTLPRLHDWHLAAIRTEMTILGALVSVLAMLLLWPQRESLELPGLLARAASADAAYMRAMLAFWNRSSLSASDRIAAERALLAPARRLCGLAVNDAEETLDHALVEHSIPLNPRREPTRLLNSASLTFTTYLRRVTRTVTTLAAIGNDDLSATDTECIATLAARLDTISQSLSKHANLVPQTTEQNSSTPESLAANQLRRLNLQVSILERTAAELTAIKPA
jgi:uncharacterized membrane protein YccC